MNNFLNKENQHLEIKHRFTGEVIFSKPLPECRDIKTLVELAIKEGADLSGANLSYADLSDANLRDANLSYADLVRANLVRANLSDANLIGANLIRADLSDANLIGANLIDVKLWSCVGNKKEIKSLQLEGYDITYTATHMQIGCENRSIEGWFNFDDKRILQMEGKTALNFWNKYKDCIKLTLELSPATPTTNKEK